MDQTHGQKLVGLSFNPSGDDAVAAAKQTFADLIDQIEALEPVDRDDQPLLADNARRHLLDAQMAVVKVLTWKGQA